MFGEIIGDESDRRMEISVIILSNKVECSRRRSWRKIDTAIHSMLSLLFAPTFAQNTLENVEQARAATSWKTSRSPRAQQTFVFVFASALNAAALETNRFCSIFRVGSRRDFFSINDVRCQRLSSLRTCTTIFVPFVLHSFEARECILISMCTSILGTRSKYRWNFVNYSVKVK